MNVWWGAGLGKGLCSGKGSFRVKVQRRHRVRVCFRVGKGSGFCLGIGLSPVSGSGFKVLVRPSVSVGGVDKVGVWVVLESGVRVGLR